MDKHVLFSMTVDELRGVIGEAIQTELQNHQTQKNKLHDEHIGKLLSQDEVAALLKVTKQTLIRWSKDGILPVVKIGRKVYYKESDVKRMLNPEG